MSDRACPVRREVHHLPLTNNPPADVSQQETMVPPGRGATGRHQGDVRVTVW